MNRATLEHYLAAHIYIGLASLYCAYAARPSAPLDTRHWTQQPESKFCRDMTPNVMSSRRSQGVNAVDMQITYVVLIR